jgi:hypothetical protein
MSLSLNLTPLTYQGVAYVNVLTLFVEFNQFKIRKYTHKCNDKIQNVLVSISALTLDCRPFAPSSLPLAGQLICTKLYNFKTGQSLQANHAHRMLLVSADYSPQQYWHGRCKRKVQQRLSQILKRIRSMEVCL